MKKALCLILMLLVSSSVYAETFYSWRYREHATDCTALTDGKTRDLCYEIDADTFYKCEPTAGDCSGSEWKPLNTTGNSATATALAANGSNCSAGNSPLGVDASGAVEGCFSVLTAEVDGSTTNEIQNLFETVSTTSGTSPVADSSTDTLSLSAGTGITVTGDATTDTITIASTVTDTDTNANTICSGTTTYLDGEGNCDDISSVYEAADADIAKVNEAETITGAWDIGGGSLEIPNSTSLPGTCTVGQVYMDTDATSGQRIYACESTNTWALQGDGGGGGSGATDIDLPVYSAKLTGAFTVFTPPTADACSQGAQIDAGGGNWRLLFDATTDECATWQFVIPSNYSSTPVLNVYYSMTSATSGTVEFEAAIMCVSSGDSADIGTASFSNVAVATETVPGTAGYMKKLAITLTDDSCAAGDTAFVVLSTDANDGTNDTATGDREVVGVDFSYS